LTFQIFSAPIVRTALEILKQLREPPVLRGGAQVVAVGDISAHEERDDGAQPDGAFASSTECSVCLREVEEGDGEAVAGVPAHVPPGVHRPVAPRPLDMPGVPVRRLCAAAA
jgi:hypothetical protein